MRVPSGTGWKVRLPSVRSGRPCRPLATRLDLDPRSRGRSQVPRRRRLCARVGAAQPWRWMHRSARMQVVERVGDSSTLWNAARSGCWLFSKQTTARGYETGTSARARAGTRGHCRHARGRDRITPRKTRREPRLLRPADKRFSLYGKKEVDGSSPSEVDAVVARDTARSTLGSRRRSADRLSAHRSTRSPESCLAPRRYGCLFAKQRTRRGYETGTSG
jgi:hypothetical protein